MAQASPEQVDVDDLAREKVQEVERLLDSSNGFKLGDLTSWLSILQQIITAADLHRTNDNNDNQTNLTKSKIETDESIYADYADDGEQFNAIDLSEQFASNSVKWTIRVRAFKLVHRLVLLSRAPLLKHLPDLVRLSFVAATSPYDDLKLQGFEMFKFLINRFASVEEKEFPGHSILEQYRTQVLSALKPAFNLDAPPYITAIASHVCCLWICRGLEKGDNLSRTYQMMMATIEKLENQSINQNSKLYTESELEQERLNILCSWAELYIAAKESDVITSVELSKLSSPSKVDSKQLNQLIKPQIESIIYKWWEALKDYALLIIPTRKLIGSSSHDNEHVYTREVALRLFAPVWPRLVLACSIWLSYDKARPTNESNDNLGIPNGVLDDLKDIDDNLCDSTNGTNKTKYFKFTFGMLMKELCQCYSDDGSEQDSLPEATTFVIRSLFVIVDNAEMKLALAEDLAVAEELYSVLYGILIKRTKSKSSLQQVLKCLLDQIFNLVAAKVVEKPGYAKYSLANLLESIMINLKKLNDSISGDKQEYEAIKVNLHIKIRNIIAIIKSAPKSCLDQIDLFNALIDSFQAILNFEADLALGTGLVSALKELYIIIPQELVIKFINAMVDSQTQVVTSLLGSIQIEDFKEQDKKAQSLVIVEVHIKSINLALDSADANNRSKLIAAYLKSFLGALPKPLSSDNLKDFPQKKSNALDIGLKYIEDLRLKYPEDFSASLCPSMKEIYENAIKLQQAIKAETESKRDAQAVKKPLVNNVGLKKPPPAKIVLKADFSNFYAKKS